MTAAAARAAHLIVDGSPTIFTDPLAEPLLGAQAEKFLAYHRKNGDHPILRGARVQAVLRSRCTEDRVAERVAEGVTQYVILGAGLDSYAYRSTSDVRVFEVDHPATQRWKRRMLAEADITVPGSVTFVPIDFEADSLADRLADNGFDPIVPAVVSWLGVVPYLSDDAIGRTLDACAAFAAGTDLVLDYLLPAGLRDADGQAYVEQVSRSTTHQGEPWLSYFSPDDMAALLAEHGFDEVDNLAQRDFPYWTGRSDGLRPVALAMLAVARKDR